MLSDDLKLYLPLTQDDFFLTAATTACYFFPACFPIFLQAQTKLFYIASTSACKNCRPHFVGLHSLSNYWSCVFTWRVNFSLAGFDIGCTELYNTRLQAYSSNIGLSHQICTSEN